MPTMTFIQPEKWNEVDGLFREPSSSPCWLTSYIWRQEAGVCVDLRDSAFLIKLRTAANMCDKRGAAVGCVLTQFWAAFCLFIRSSPLHPDLTPHVPFSVLPSIIPAKRHLHTVISHSNATVLPCPVLHDIRKSITLVKGSQASPTCPVDKSSITMILEHWCNETDGRKPHLPQNNLTQWNAVHHKVQMDWAGIEFAYAGSHFCRLTNMHFSANRIETALVVGSLNWFKLGSASQHVLYSSLSTLPNLMFQKYGTVQIVFFITELLAVDRTTSWLVPPALPCSVRR